MWLVAIAPVGWREAVLPCPKPVLRRPSTPRPPGCVQFFEMESLYPEAGIGGGNDHCFKLSYTWAKTC